MTSLPALPTAKKLGLVIDLDVCVGCHACVVNCKEWNTGGYGAALSDQKPYGADVSGAWLNRVHSFEVVPEGGEIVGEAGEARIVHFPKSCLHCEDAPCVTVCPTGASYKRAEDGIVLVDEEKCIGCGLCAWSCPYGAREMDLAAGVMKKCTLCIDRIYNETIEEVDRQPACVRTCPANARHFGDLGDPSSVVSIMVAERGGIDLMPEQGTRPVNKYLPPRPRTSLAACASQMARGEDTSGVTGFFAWLDGMLDRI
ncbi:4Fe-4S dicluster domain-containing protein [Mesorhizobium sp. NPDC059054]|uniref:4Fe-4S dicluster domain-containing protein n=1 Tax=Mesorhizobium sp. NPDC059054 TaxID=3346711 RepID=UPI00369E599A